MWLDLFEKMTRNGPKNGQFLNLGPPERKCDFQGTTTLRPALSALSLKLFKVVQPPHWPRTRSAGCSPGALGRTFRNFQKHWIAYFFNRMRKQRLFCCPTKSRWSGRRWWGWRTLLLPPCLPVTAMRTTRTRCRRRLSWSTPRTRGPAHQLLLLLLRWQKHHPTPCFRLRRRRRRRRLRSRWTWGNPRTLEAPVGRKTNTHFAKWNLK